MKTELEVFNNLIDIVIKHSCDNEAVITDVSLWAKAWREEMNQAINYNSCCVNHQGKEKTDIDITQTREKSFNFEVEQLVKKQGRWLMINTDLDVEKILDFEQEFN